MNTNLKSAKRNKNDEFYTQLKDIENELLHYRQHFKDKVVYCNCDDPRVSNFFRYFWLNFKKLGLKKLISTSYQSMNENAFSNKDSDKGLVFIYEGENDDSNLPKEESVKAEYLEGDGDFRSEECIKFLKEADIVVTNPPFSLFREYVTQLIEYKKQFLIIGNFNAITYKEIFPLIKDNKMWLGYSPRNMKFATPNQELKSVNACWFTNLDHTKRHEELVLYRQYNEKDYLKYDNYNAIDVSQTKDIPEDFTGIMGVPITFLEKYNPDQFEIIGLLNGRDNLAGIKTTKDYSDYKEVRQNGELTGASGKKTNGNPVLKGKPSKGNYFIKDDDVVYSLYARILIQHKNPKTN